MVAKFDPDAAPPAPVVLDGNAASTSPAPADGLFQPESGLSMDTRPDRPVSHTEAAAHLAGAEEELADRVDALLSFLSETEIDGKNFNSSEAARPISETRSSPSPPARSTERKGAPPHVAGTAAAPETIDAIKKLEARLAALTVLQNLCNDIDERLVRAERALQRTEDLVADRTFMHLYSRLGEGLVRTEETCRRMETYIADRTLQQLSARIDARLADTEDAVHRIERLVADGSLRSAAGRRESLARTEEELRRLKRIVETESSVPSDGDVRQRPPAGDAVRALSSTYGWIPAMGGNVKHLAKRAAPVLLLLTVTAIVGFGRTDVRARPDDAGPASSAVPTDPSVRVSAVESASPPASSPTAEAAAPALAASLPSMPEGPGPAIRPDQARAEDTPEAPRSTPYVGTLLVASEPAGASVFVNGRPVGVTPLKIPEQRAGSLALRITREGFQRWTAAVQVPAGRSTQITATLRPESP